MTELIQRSYTAALKVMLEEKETATDTKDFDLAESLVVAWSNMKWDACVILLRFGANATLVRDPNAIRDFISYVLQRDNAESKLGIVKNVLTGRDSLELLDIIEGGSGGSLMAIALPNTGNVEPIRELMSFGATLTPEIFHLAVECGDVEVVKLFVSIDPTLVDPSNEINQSPLMTACYKRHTEIVELLLEAGAEVNAQSQCGQTPLVFATIGDSTEIIRILVQAKADLEVKDMHNQTALSVALFHRIGNPRYSTPHLSVGKESWENDPRYMYYDRVVSEESTLCLLDCGAQFQNSFYGENNVRAALMYSMNENKSELFRRLINHGRSLDFGSAVGRGFLDALIFKKQYSFLGILLSEKKLTEPVVSSSCVYDRSLNKQTTLLNSLVVAKNARFVTVLLEHGVNPNVLDTNSSSALGLVVSGLHLYPAFDVMKALLRHGANPNIECAMRFDSVCARFRTPMRAAVEKKRPGYSRMMWIAGGRVNNATMRHVIAMERENLGITDMNVSRVTMCAEEIIRFLLQISSSPRSLMDACRLAIREQIRAPHVKEKVDTLLLPESVKEFLKFPELDSIEKEFKSKYMVCDVKMFSSASVTEVVNDWRDSESEED